MPRELLSPFPLRSSGTTSVELHWRLIGKLGNGQTSSHFVLLLDRPKGNFFNNRIAEIASTNK